MFSKPCFHFQQKSVVKMFFKRNKSVGITNGQKYMYVALFSYYYLHYSVYTYAKC